MKLIKSIIGDRETVTVERSLLVRAAARLMSDRNIGAVPVLDGDRLVGIFSERDVLTRVVAAGCDPDTTRVGEVMSSELVVADPAESYAACLSRMRAAHVRHVIVVIRTAGRDCVAAGPRWRWTSTRSDAIGLLNAHVST